MALAVLSDSQASPKSTDPNPKTASGDSSEELVRSKSVDRRLVVLEAARMILIEDGYRELSLRHVATRAQMHLKTLQHYFPSKSLLIKETIHFVSDRIAGELYNMTSPLIASSDYVAAFKTTVNVMLSSCENEENWRVFFELWALSGREDDARDAIDLVFSRNRYNLELLIARLNPRISRADVTLRAALVASQTSGLSLFLNSRHPHHAELDGLRDEAIRRMLELVLRKD